MLLIGDSGPLVCRAFLPPRLELTAVRVFCVDRCGQVVPPPALLRRCLDSELHHHNRNRLQDQDHRARGQAHQAPNREAPPPVPVSQLAPPARPPRPSPSSPIPHNPRLPLVLCTSWEPCGSFPLTRHSLPPPLAVGHRRTGAVPDNYDRVLPWRDGYPPRLRRDGRAELQQCVCPSPLPVPPPARASREWKSTGRSCCALVRKALLSKMRC